MNARENARLTPKGREEMVRAVVDYGLTQGCGRASGTIPLRRRWRKWVNRFYAGGVGWFARSILKTSFIARPNSCSPHVRHEALRRQRYIGKQIANGDRCLARHRQPGLAGGAGSPRLKALEPAEPLRRYEREHPGELIHLDIKKLGKFNQIGHRITGDRRGQSNSRGVGWECVPCLHR